jgi:chromosome segregation ATPase
MKPLGIHVMVPFLSAIAVSVCATAVASVHSDGGTGSVKQIRKTLQNLLRSIEDAGSDVDALAQKRQQWCNAAISECESAKEVTDTSLQSMQAQLTEHEAEVEEATGTVQQVRADIEMVQHTIKQTDGMLRDGTTANTKLLQSLLRNKQISLSSLQGQLDVAIPVLA